MSKTVRRAQKRPKRWDKDNVRTADDDRHRARPGTGKSRGNSIADNRWVRLIALLILPVVFGVFGLIMFPPSFVSPEADVTSQNQNSISNKTVSEQILPETKSSSDDDTNMAAGKSTKNDPNSRTSQTTHKSKKSKTKTDNKHKSKSKSGNQKAPEVQEQTTLDEEVPPEIRNFQPTFLDAIVAKDIVVDGKVVQPIELTKDNPNSPVRVYKYEGFLSDSECSGLMRAHAHHLKEANKNDPIICFDDISTLGKHLRDAGKTIQVSRKDFTEGTTCVNASFSMQLKQFLKWSFSTAFYPGESKFSTIFEDRVFQATGLKPSNGGKFQITSYPEGIGYKTHTDCILQNSDKRDRFATILVYLQDVKEGGQTQFPELGISVTPRKGHAIVWNNMNTNGECEPLSIHTAASVVSGHKYIIQRWYYYQSFYQLGKRTQEPHLPVRKPGQAKVNCDEYEQGSCRWYDEWNYDHILDYRSQQRNLH